MKPLTKKPNRFVLIICLIVLFVGVVFLVAAAILYFVGKSKIQNEIISNMVINNAATFAEPRTIILRKFYFLEVLNPDQLVNGSDSKAKMRQRGPYVYENKAQKRNIIFSKDSNNLTFSPVNTFYFRPDLSNGSEFDSLTVLNLPLLAALDKIESGELDLNPIFLSIFNLQLNENTNVFRNRTVYDMLSGYTDFVVQLIDQYRPGMLKDGKFGLFNGKNASEIQNLTILTGKDNINNVGSIVAWNNLRSLTFWDTELANRIKGTDGSSNGPFKTSSDSLYIFNSELCRSIKMNYKRENKVYDIKVLDFTPDKDMFHNTTQNEGFYRQGFIGNGVFNIKRCSGYPVYLSQPHFLNAERSFIEAIEGLDSPNEELHNTFIKLYPLLGVTIHANIRIQLNFKLQKSSKIDLFNNVSEILLPSLWFEDEIILNEDSKEKLIKLNQIVQLVYTFPLVLVIIGSILTFFSVCILVLSFVYFNIKF